jgi:hypothetical protein
VEPCIAPRFIYAVKEYQVAENMLQTHTQKRVLERFGRTLTKLELSQIISDIKTHKLKYVGKGLRGRTLWETEIDGWKAIVVYHEETQWIITVLSASSFYKRRRKREKRTKRKSSLCR